MPLKLNRRTYNQQRMRCNDKSAFLMQVPIKTSMPCLQRSSRKSLADCMLHRTFSSSVSTGELCTLANRQLLPAIYPVRFFCLAGGVMSYGTDLADGYRHIGRLCRAYPKGEKPADLPVCQSTKFEFVINLQTAKALDLEYSTGALASRRRGDRVRGAICCTCSRPLLCRFSAAGNDEPLHALWRPAAEKRQGTKSREVGH